MKLPKAEQIANEWQAATEALIMAAEGRGPLLHARVGVMRALNRNAERAFILYIFMNDLEICDTFKQS